MWKFIVYWTLSTTVPTSCPEASRVDEFGRNNGMYGNGMACAVYHAKVVSKVHEKEFDNKRYAVDFYLRAKQQEKGPRSNVFNYLSGPRMSNVKLDSIFVNERQH